MSNFGEKLQYEKKSERMNKTIEFEVKPGEAFDNKAFHISVILVKYIKSGR